MRISKTLFSIAAVVIAMMASDVYAQPPGGGGGGRGGRGGFDAASLLERFDTDKDGKLAKSELSETRMKDMMATADADKDGFISKAELEKMVANRGQGGGRGGRGGRGGEGGAEGGRGGRGGPEGGRPDFMKMMMERMPVMMALDADKDGEISAAEIKNAVAALKKLDKNGDGKLAGDEITPPQPEFGGRGGRGGGEAGGRGGRGGGGGRGGAGGGGGQDRPQRPSRPE